LSYLAYRTNQNVDIASIYCHPLSTVAHRCVQSLTVSSSSAVATCIYTLRHSTFNLNMLASL